MGLWQVRGIDVGPNPRRPPGLAAVSGRCTGRRIAEQVGERADRVVQSVRKITGDVLLFSSGHFIRVLTARWLGLGPGTGGKYFLLSPASLSALSYEHNLSRPVIRLWNDDHHVAA